MARNAEHYDAVLFGASRAALVRALRQHLTLGQLAQLTPGDRRISAKSVCT